MSSFRVRLPDQTNGLSVAAAPVDTFQYPSQQSQLSQLAGALAEVSPKLGRYSDTLNASQKQSAMERASAAAAQAVKEGKTTLGQLKRGEIAAHESPYFWGYFEEQFGQLTSGRYASGLAEYIQKTPGAEDSIDGFDKAAAEYTKAFETELGAQSGSEFFQAGYQKRSADELNRLRFSVAQRVGEQSQTAMLERNPAVLRQVIIDGKKNNQSPEEIQAELTKQLGAMRALLPSQSVKIDESAAQAIIETAVSVRDAALGRTLLDALSREGGGTLRATKAGTAAYDRLEGEVAQAKIADDTRIVQAIEARVAVTRNKVGLDIAGLIRNKASGADVTDALNKAGDELYEAGDIDGRQKVIQMWSNNKAAADEDPKLVEDLTIKANEGQISVHALSGYLENRTISQPTYVALSGLVERHDSLLRSIRSEARSEQRTVKGLALQNGGFVLQAMQNIVNADTQNRWGGADLSTRFYVYFTEAMTAEAGRTGQAPSAAFAKQLFDAFKNDSKNFGVIQNIYRGISEQMGPQAGAGAQPSATDSLGGRMPKIPLDENGLPIVPQPPALTPAGLEQKARAYLTDRTAILGLDPRQAELVQRRARSIAAAEAARTPTSTKKP